MVLNHLYSSVPTTPQVKLIVNAIVCLADGTELPLKVLVDTGAEVSLIRRGLVDAKFFRESDCPRNFVTADLTRMEGGSREVPCEIVMAGLDTGNGVP